MEAAIFELQHQPWYFPNISRQETEYYLSQSNMSTFLVRNSSMQGCYACSVYDVQSNSFTHALIEPTPSGGFRFQEDPVVECPSIVGLIASWLEKRVDTVPFTGGRDVGNAQFQFQQQQQQQFQPEQINPQFQQQFIPQQNIPQNAPEVQQQPESITEQTTEESPQESNESPATESTEEPEKQDPPPEDESIQPLEQKLKQIKIREASLAKKEKLLTLRETSVQKQKALIQQEESEVDSILAKLEKEEKKLDSKMEELKKKKVIVTKEEDKKNMEEQLEDLQQVKDKVVEDREEMQQWKKQIQQDKQTLEDKEKQFDKEYAAWKEKKEKEKEKIDEEQKKVKKLQEMSKKDIEERRLRVNQEYSRILQIRFKLRKQKQEIEKREKQIEEEKKNLTDDKKEALKERQEELATLKEKYAGASKILKEKGKQVDLMYQQLVTKNRKYELLEEQMSKSKNLQEEADRLRGTAQKQQKQIEDLEKKMKETLKKADEAENQSRGIHELVSTQSNILKKWQVPSANKYFGTNEEDLDKFERKRRELFEEVLKKMSSKFSRKKKSCFVSYAWDDERFRPEAKRLITYLEKAGFDVPLDSKTRDTESIVFSKPPDKTDYSIVIGTTALLKQLDGKPDESKKDSTNRIKSEMEIIKGLEEKRWKPVLFEGTEEESLPEFLRKTSSTNFVKEDYYDAVLALVRGLLEMEEKDDAAMKEIKTEYDSELNDEYAKNRQINRNNCPEL